MCCNPTTRKVDLKMLKCFCEQIANAEQSVMDEETLRQKTHNREVLGSNPHYGDHFSGTIHLDQSLEQKLWKNSNLALLHVL